MTLSHKEFDLLSMLVQGTGDVVTREALMEGIWDTAWVGAVAHARRARRHAPRQAGPARS